MIVSESDLLLTALDRRMQVDRMLAIDPVRSLGNGSEGPRSSTLPGTAAALTTVTPALIEHLPLGQVFAARVAEVPEANHVIVELGRLRIALAWPGGNGPAPAAGETISLRVLAHDPMLLFENIRSPSDQPAAVRDPLTQLSPVALQMQTAKADGDGVLHFTVPILEIEVVPLETSEHESQSTSQAAQRSANSPSAHIALDDVIVARSGSIVEASDPAPVRQTPNDGAINLAGMLPLVLQGPAWPGQDVELVVRRDRADEAFDNPALDQWCGEIVIDLPHLGRVAGHLSWSMQGLRIRLEGQNDVSVASMSAAAPELARALADVALPVLALSVGGPVAATAFGIPPRHG
jgi:hypothetical protein